MLVGRSLHRSRVFVINERAFCHGAMCMRISAKTTRKLRVIQMLQIVTFVDVFEHISTSNYRK